MMNLRARLSTLIRMVFLCCIPATNAGAQCVNNPLVPPIESLVASEAADRIIERLLVPVRKNIKMVLSARIVLNDDLPGRIAIACLDKDGNRLILIDDRFLAAAEEWAVLGAVAHEIGHHLRAHIVFNRWTRREDQRVPGKRRELEADYVAGYLLRQIGATRAETVAALKKLGRGDSPSHPARYERVLRSVQGWTDADAEHRLITSETSEVDPITLFETQESTDIEGSDIGFSWPNTTVEQCAKHCLERGSCLGFSYQKWDSHCFLKRDLQLTLRDPRSVVGVVKPLDIPLASQSGELEMLRRRGKLFKGRYQELDASSWKECRDACRNDASCVGLSFLSDVSTCRTYSQIDTLVEDQRANSAFFADNYSWINPD